MRYQVGQHLLAVHFSYGGDCSLRSRPLYRQPYLFGDQEPPTSVDLVLLKVVEHHKVLGDYDPVDAEKKYDGFILEGESGERWTNQYPRASYGQTTDTADRRFSVQVAEGVDFGKLFRDLEKVGSGQFIEAHLLTDFLDAVRRATANKELDGPLKAKLLALYNTIMEGVASNYPEVKLDYVHVENKPWRSHHNLTYIGT